MDNSCGETFANSVSCYSSMYSWRAKDTWKDCIGTLEIPLVVSQHMLNRTNGVCQIILLFYIVLYWSKNFSLRFYSVRKPRDCYKITLSTNSGTWGVPFHVDYSSQLVKINSKSGSSSSSRSSLKYSVVSFLFHIDLNKSSWKDILKQTGRIFQEH